MTRGSYQDKMENLEFVSGIVDRLECEIRQLKSWIKSQKIKQNSFSKPTFIEKREYMSYVQVQVEESQNQNYESVVDPSQDNQEDQQQQLQQGYENQLVNITPDIIVGGDMEMIIKEEHDPLDDDNDEQLENLSLVTETMNEEPNLGLSNNLFRDDSFDQSDGLLLPPLPLTIENTPGPSTASSPPSRSKKILYPCPVCGKKYTRSHDMKRHFQVHQTGQVHNCKFCTMEFDTTYKKDRHVRKYHRNTQDLPYKCTFKDCTHSNSTYESLMKHQEEHLGIVCHYCVPEKVFYRRQNYLCHLRYMHFICTGKNCNKRFLTRIGLAIHKKKNHN